MFPWWLQGTLSRTGSGYIEIPVRPNACMHAAHACSSCDGSNQSMLPPPLPSPLPPLPTCRLFPSAAYSHLPPGLSWTQVPVPLLILRDPPGDRSFARLDSSISTAVKLSMITNDKSTCGGLGAS